MALRAGFHGTVGQPSAQIIDGSLRFNQSNKTYLKKTPGSAGNRRTWTYSAWIKRGDLASSERGLFSTFGSSHPTTALKFGSNQTLEFLDYQGGYICQKITSQVFRDTGWYHIVIAIDTTLTTTEDRFKLYVNGERVTSFSTNNNISTQNQELDWNSATEHNLFMHGNEDTPYDGMGAQTYFIDGAALGPEKFGFTDPLTGTWRPKKFKSSINNGTTWSSGISGTLGGSSVTVETPERAFNGNTSNSAQFNTTQNDPGILTWTVPGGGISASNFRIFTYQPQTLSGMTYEMSINGGAYVQDTGNWAAVAANADGWSTLQTVPNGFLTSIALRNTYTSGNSTVRIYAIEVDGIVLVDGAKDDFGTNGFYLPMDGNSPIGEDKSDKVTPNDGTVWSNSLTSSSGFRSSEPKTNAFDGNTSSICSAVGSGTITFTSPVTFASNSTIRVFLHGGSHTVTVNGGSNQTISDGAFHTVTYSNPGNATFTMTFHRGGGADTGVRAIEINGVILTDGVKGNSWTPVNFGGSNSVEKATGALPILNTTQGGTQATVGVRTDAYAQGDPNNQLSRNYSSNTTATGGFSGSYPKTNLFDGAAPADANRAEAASNDDPINITFDPPITVSSTISLWSGKSSTRYQINDSGTYTTYSDAVGSYKDISHSGSLSNIKILHGSAGQAAGISAIKIDGTQLIDSGLVLALPLVGSANDVSNRINSESTTKTITTSGAVNSSVQSNLYSESFFFDGSDDYVNITDNSDFTVGSGPFTLEFWTYKTSSGEDFFCGSSNSSGSTSSMSYSVQTGGGSPSNSLRAHVGDGSSLYTVNSGIDFVLNKWVHIAFVRDGNTLRLFQDGVQVDTTSFSGTVKDSSDSFMIGRGFEANSHKNFPGYIQDFRFYKGVAKYTSNFIPASTNSDILPDTPSGMSGGSKLTKITDGSVSFDGTNDSLSVADHADFTFGSGDFTMEAFVYNRSSGYRSIVMKYGGSPASSSWFWSMYNGQNQFYYYSGSNEPSVTSSKTHYNKWVHCAVSREGNTIRIFDDGELTGTLDVSSYATMNDSTVPLDIGVDYADNYDMDGFISNVRIVKGTALYTSNFTPPSAPLTDVTNTKLLCCQKEQIENNFIRMFKSSTLYTTKADILANATEIGDGASLSSEYWYIVPEGTEPIGSDVFTNDGSVTTPHGSNHFALYWRNGSSWTQTLGTYGPSEYSDFDYKSDDSSSTYSVYPARDFYVFGADDSPSEPKLISGTLPTRAKYYTITGAVKPGTITANGNVAATNFNPFNTDINTVRGQETTGYPTWNPLRVSGQTLSNNNMTTTGASGNVLGSMFTPTSGKFYWEVTAGSDYTMTGIQRENNYDMSYPGNSAGQIAMYLNTGVGSGQLYKAGSVTSSWGGGVTGDVIGVALDMDNNKVYFYNNGRGLGAGGFTGTPEAVDVPTGGGYTANCRSGSGAYDGPSTINFGQTPFKFPPPDGFQPLNAANTRPETVIARPDQYVTATTYSGNGDSSGRHINIGFRPDLIWLKSRGSGNHGLYDSVRGPDKRLQSDGTATEGTVVFPGASNFGFDFGSETYYNATSTDYVAWTWKAGGSKGTFNIDGEGYANASDVNMSVGALNSATYNTSNRWSDDYSGATIDSSYPITQAFDGNRNTASRVSATQTAMSVDLTNITVTDKIEVCGELGYITPYVSVTVGGVIHQIGGDPNTLISGSAGTTTRVITGVSGALTNVTVGRVNSGRTFLSQIIVDGKILVDDNITPPTLPSIANIGASVGTKQGFSIIQYQGGGNSVTTVSHGLSQKPQFMIIKNMDDADDWTCYHEGAGETNYLTLNSAAAATDGTMFGDIKPTSTVFTLGAAPGSDYHNRANRSGYDYISYLWHDVPGLQKFGVYEGNSQPTAGNYIHLGFSPAILIIKDIDSTGYWYITDSERNPTNDTTTSYVWVNSNASEQNDYSVDLLSDGFDLYASSGNLNASRTYIYAAWAEAPTVNLYGGGANAR